jgi:uncharacterized protein (DUF885 family)
VPAQNSTSAAHGLVGAVADRFVDEYAAADPVTATYDGIAGHDDELTDYSTEGFAERDAILRRTLRALAGLEPADERERVAKESMLERLGLDVERHQAGELQSELNVIDSPMHAIRQIFDLMATETDQDWERVAARLEGVPAALDSHRRGLLDAARAGHAASRRQVVACAAQCRSWTGRGAGNSDGDVFSDLVAPYPSPGALRQRLDAAANDARQAYARFGQFLDAEMAPLAPTRDAVGRERYTLASRYFLGAEVDLAETYAWGWSELARIETEMAATAEQIVPAAGVDAAVDALDRDPTRNITGKEAFRDWMQTLADRTLAELAGTHFDLPDPVRRIECRIAPTADGSIYYTGPSEDFSRPGRIWWGVPDGIDSFSTWREVTTVFHEGVPGHHLQVAQTAYRSETLNRWQRLMGEVSGHGEGWALYAERLMDDFGYLDDPGEKLGMLDAQGVRAARVIIDIGMHLELEIPRENPFRFAPGERWTPELGLVFLREHSRIEEPVLRFELDRYLGWPGQAPSYKVGERLWLACRADAQRRQGADFDLKGFHRASLDLGPLGLGPLREALARL